MSPTAETAFCFVVFEYQKLNNLSMLKVHALCSQKLAKKAKQQVHAICLFQKWKVGKRKAEKDEYTGGKFFLTLDAPPTTKQLADVYVKLLFII